MPHPDQSCPPPTGACEPFMGSEPARLILAIPVLIVLSLLGQGLIWVYWIGILVRGRPVRWLFDANVAIQRFTLRAYAYLLLLTDRYPPFDGEWQVRFEGDYPQRLSRWRVGLLKEGPGLPP